MSQQLIKLGCHPVSEHSIVPVYGSEFSACFDLASRLQDVDAISAFDEHNTKYKIHPQIHCNGKKYITLEKGQRVLIPCGWIFDIPEGHSLRMHPRSGLSLKKGIVLPNSQGIIDADFPNESMIMLVNISDEPYDVFHGDEMCQGEVVSDLKALFAIGEVGSKPVPKQSSRTDGFGHTTPNLVK